MTKQSQKMPPKVARLFAMLTAAYPGLTWQSYRYIDEGWDHEVLILDEQLVFRFPDDEEYTNKLKSEISILGYLKDRVPVRVPDYTYVPVNKNFAGYALVPGEQLLAPYLQTLPRGDYKEIVKQLAGFLSAIHTQDLAQSIFREVSSSYLEEDQKALKQQAATNLKQALSAKDFALVEEIIVEVDELVVQKLPQVFIHNDVYSRHLLWDAKNRKLGVIGFNDMCIGDPAVDFAELYEYGAAFVKAVFDQYTGPQDDTFLERAWIYQKWVGVYMMADHFETPKITFEEARETFDRIKITPR
ncbi:MAG TPA: aminoglycoside phosphotransferase family protein [Verrucomicrobiae bacterium]|nr:aminoglycoside phosphotransferase family protein [Verrucomicrobiae bacterium]